MPDEVKVEIQAPVTAEQVEETKAETEQIKTVTASVNTLVAFLVIHWKQVIAIILATGLVIGFSFSGWKVGKIEKSAVEIRK